MYGTQVRYLLEVLVLVEIESTVRKYLLEVLVLVECTESKYVLT
jgi:hypothetical protein